MATHTFLDTSDDISLAANWDSGVAPSAWAGADKARILRCTRNVTVGVNLSGVAITELVFGDGITGRIGTPAAPLYFGSITDVYQNTPKCRQLSFRTAGTVGTYRVLNSGNDTYGCHLYGGTFTNIFVMKSPSFVTDAVTCTLLALMHSGDAQRDVNAVLNSGGAYTTVRAMAGRASIYSAATNVYNHLATVDLLSDSVTHTLVEQYGGLINWLGKSNIITKYNGYGGLFDASFDPQAKTLTNADCYTGNTMDLDNGVNTVTISNPISVRGGRVIVPSGSSGMTVVVAPPGGWGV